MIGARFGRLVVVAVAPLREGVQLKWKCRCDCGKEHSVTQHKLTSGHTKSCGCLASETTTARNYKHGHSAKFTPEYHSWASMVQRCTNAGRKSWPYYGGRGITACERWLTFENFLADMGARPEGTTLDRIDNNGNYEPNNCRWASKTTQAANRRVAHERFDQEILMLIMAGHRTLPELYLITRKHDEVVKKAVRRLRDAGLVRTSRVLTGNLRGSTLHCEIC